MGGTFRRQRKTWTSFSPLSLLSPESSNEADMTEISTPTNVDPGEDTLCFEASEKISTMSEDEQVTFATLLSQDGSSPPESIMPQRFPMLPSATENFSFGRRARENNASLTSFKPSSIPYLMIESHLRNETIWPTSDGTETNCNTFGSSNSFSSIENSQIESCLKHSSIGFATVGYEHSSTPYAFSNFDNATVVFSDGSLDYDFTAQPLEKRNCDVKRSDSTLIHCGTSEQG
ncbi:hypothetical protein ACTXT7_000367 [Hymenolepis weldensis]